MGRSKIKIILITADGFEHRYVANKLSQKIDLDAIVVDRGIKKSKLQRIHYLLKKYTFVQLINRSFARILSVLNNEAKKIDHANFSIFGKQLSEHFFNEKDLINVEGINTDHGIKIIESLKPDLLLIYGTGIIGDKILNIATKHALNMHTGLSPFYRGASCPFWALYNEQPEMIGATIHECTSDIDGGVIYKTQVAKLFKTDDEYCAFLRAVTAGAKIYQEVVLDLIENENLKGETQDFNLGKEFRASMKNWWHDLSVKRKIKNGLILRYVTKQELKT
jgi:methionyl-tRNA formyltransferase